MNHILDPEFRFLRTNLLTNPSPIAVNLSSDFTTGPQNEVCRGTPEENQEHIFEDRSMLQNGWTAKVLSIRSQLFHSQDSSATQNHGGAKRDKAKNSILKSKRNDTTAWYSLAMDGNWDSISTRNLTMGELLSNTAISLAEKLASTHQKHPEKVEDLSPGLKAVKAESQNPKPQCPGCTFHAKCMGKIDKDHLSSRGRTEKM